MLLSVLLLAAAQQPAPAPALPRIDLRARVRAHLDVLIAHGQDVHGPQATSQWLASLDRTTRAYPFSQPKAAAGQRVYRHIDAPYGSTLYWDLPQLEVALRLSDLAGDARYADAARAYAAASLELTRGAGGLPAWGNHYFWDFEQDVPVGFGYGAYGSPTPIPPSDRGHHELRPHPVPWDLLASIDAAATRDQVWATADAHLVGGVAGATGAFDRHGNVTGASGPQYPFLESGAVLIDALAWLHAQGGPRAAQAAQLADQIVDWVHASADPVTGLLPNQQATHRWDRWVSTSEVGLWAQGLLRAGRRVPQHRDAWEQAAADVLGAWLAAAWDPATRRYWGKVRIVDGLPELSNSTAYQPGDRAEAWNGFFPTHDYLIEVGHAATTLAARTGDARFLDAVDRIAAILREDRPTWKAHDGQGLYAGQAGRAILFLQRAGRLLDRPALRAQAADLAYECLLALGGEGLFRTHAGEERYDAVDAVGFLLDALLRLGEIVGDPAPESLARWSFGDSQFQLAPDAAASAVVAHAIVAGPGLSATSSVRGDPAPSLAATSLEADAPDAAAAFAAGDWYELRVGAQPGQRVLLAGLQFRVQRSGGGQAPTGYAIRSSADGFASDLARDDLRDDVFDLCFVPLRGQALDPGQDLVLRIAFHGGAGSGNLYARVDELVLLGTVLPN